jgi:Tfp pilus assembly protein FimT
MICKKIESERGFSVMEMIIVILIGMILVGIAISQFGTSRTQLQRQNIAREFKNTLERARFDSVRRRTDDNDFANMSQIIIKNSTSYEVRIDLNQDGIISSGEVKLVDFTGRSEAKILAGSNTFPITIRFNRKGHITTDANGAAVTPLFTICNGNCSVATTITPENANVISISPTGTVSMLYGGDVIPPLTAPNISNVSNSSGINLWLTVIPPATTNTANNTNTSTNTGGTNTNSIVNTVTNTVTNIINPNPTPTPTATPTATPVSTPTATPVSTPTPAPTPQPTPTPTPSLRVCSLNERPGNPAICQCVAPRSVKANGKCQ